MRRLADHLGQQRFYIEVQRHYSQGDRVRLRLAVDAASTLGLDVVATGGVRYVTSDEAPTLDILMATAQLSTLSDCADSLYPNREFYLRSPDQMQRLFVDHRAWVMRSEKIAQQYANASDILPVGPNCLPTFATREDSDDRQLRRLCLTGLPDRYRQGAPRRQLEHELQVIQQMELAGYFLLVTDIADFTRYEGIRYQGRGSAANSLVAYVLGITPVDPIKPDLVFERFLSPKRESPSDIDLDFAADRREEVIQYVYRRYGDDYVAMACTFNPYRVRGALQDAARALDIKPSAQAHIRQHLDLLLSESDDLSQNSQANVGGSEEISGPQLAHLKRLMPRMLGIPRHRSIHSGGMIVTQQLLRSVVPVEPAAMPGRSVTQWDKESLELHGIAKVDVLSLRALGAIENSVRLIEQQERCRIDLDALEPDDPGVYDMICDGKIPGVFPIESEAKINMIAQTQPRNLKDLAIEVALVRPGPIQGNAIWSGHIVVEDASPSPIRTLCWNQPLRRLSALSSFRSRYSKLRAT